MKLSATERLMVTQLFPQQGNIKMQMTMMDILGKVKLTQAEELKVGYKEIRNPEGQVMSFTWKEKVKCEAEIPFEDAEIQFLKEQVTRVDAASQVTGQMLGLCIAIQSYDFKKKEEK